MVGGLKLVPQNCQKFGTPPCVKISDFNFEWFKCSKYGIWYIVEVARKRRLIIKSEFFLVSMAQIFYIFKKNANFEFKIRTYKFSTPKYNILYMTYTFEVKKRETLLNDCTWYVCVENNEPVCPTSKESMSKEFATNYGARLFTATTNVFFSIFLCKDSINKSTICHASCLSFMSSSFYYQP